MSQYSADLTRRHFFERLGAGALAGAMGLAGRSGRPRLNATSWTPAPLLNNPNILVIMVDQMRLPAWLDSNQLAMLQNTVLPNIAGRIQNSAYNFGQYFCAATNCTPSRATLLTGLYAPQTAMYTGGNSLQGCGQPAGPPVAPTSLNPAFPTWGHALALLNPAYAGNIWWFGKWHLSTQLNSAPLAPYGFNSRTYPGGSPPYNPSPDGAPNEGTKGGMFQGVSYASDSMIVGDFIGWLQGQAPTPAAPASPWCATVSLINPHDISQAPGWLATGPFPPPGLCLPTVYFQPPTGSPPALYSRKPSPWNYENVRKVSTKPGLQRTFLSSTNKAFGSVTDWVLFLNQYFWLQNFVDQQVGLVLDALYNSPHAANTIVVFLSDHGEYAGSHGLHDKGSAVYDESLRVPLSVQFPGQTGAISMNQMCSSVDFFGLICDLATGGAGQWRQSYPDLAPRQSLWSFLFSDTVETRVAPAPIGLPFIFHTFDDSKVKGKSHIVCLRTKLDLNTGTVGAKLAFYSEWATCTTYPDTTPPDSEFYDYNPQTTNNTRELGNDYYSTNPVTQSTIAQYVQVLGSWGSPGTGLITSELNAPLVGTGTDGNPLSQAQTAARQSYFNYMAGPGICIAS